MWHSFFSNFQGDGARRFPFFGGGDAVSLAPEVREWKSVSGEPIHISATRRLVGNLVLDGDSDPETVRVQVGAKCYRLPISELSVADREYIKTERAKKRKTPTAPDWLVEEKSAQARVDDALKMVDDFSKAVKEKYGVIRERALPEIKSRFGVLRGKFGKSPRVVATVAELYDAVENAVDGETIALEDGTYRLSEKIKLKDKELTLVGKSGNRERVKITVSGKGNSVFEVNAGVKLTLEDLSLEAKEWSAIESLVAPGAATVKATRCNITTLGGQDRGQTAISWCARYILHDCDVVGGMNTAGYRQAVWVMQGGSITAENCNFMGKVCIDFESQPSSLKNCLIHDSGKGAGVDISGDSSNNRGPCCKIVDCTIYDVGGCGVCVEYGGEALVRGGEIRNVHSVSVGFRTEKGGSLKLDDVKISKCKQGVYVKDGGKCEATNLTFTDVDDKWRIADDAGIVTHNGRRMTDAD